MSHLANYVKSQALCRVELSATVEEYCGLINKALGMKMTFMVLLLRKKNTTKIQVVHELMSLAKTRPER